MPCDFRAAEHRRRMAEQMAHQPAQARNVGHPVAFHNITQQRHVHVVSQQLQAGWGIQPLRFRKSASGKVVEEGSLQG